MSDTKAAKPVSDAADVARRLRGYNTYDSTKMRHNTPQVCLEAADTIERLLAENSDLLSVIRNAHGRKCICEYCKGDQLQGGSDK